jgi:hypothetical protein
MATFVYHLHMDDLHFHFPQKFLKNTLLHDVSDSQFFVSSEAWLFILVPFILIVMVNRWLIKPKKQQILSTTKNHNIAEKKVILCNKSVKRFESPYHISSTFIHEPDFRFMNLIACLQYMEENNIMQLKKMNEYILWIQVTIAHY